MPSTRFLLLLPALAACIPINERNNCKTYQAGIITGYFGGYHLSDWAYEDRRFETALLSNAACECPKDDSLYVATRQEAYDAGIEKGCSLPEAECDGGWETPPDLFEFAFGFVPTCNEAFNFE